MQFKGSGAVAHRCFPWFLKDFERQLPTTARLWEAGASTLHVMSRPGESRDSVYGMVGRAIRAPAAALTRRSSRHAPCQPECLVSPAVWTRDRATWASVSVEATSVKPMACRVFCGVPSLGRRAPAPVVTGACPRRTAWGCYARPAVADGSHSQSQWESATLNEWIFRIPASFFGRAAWSLPSAALWSCARHTRTTSGGSKKTPRPGMHAPAVGVRWRTQQIPGRFVTISA